MARSGGAPFSLGLKGKKQEEHFTNWISQKKNAVWTQQLNHMHQTIINMASIIPTGSLPWMSILGAG